MITTTQPQDDGPLRPLRFRKLFEVPQGAQVSRATLYATAYGVYEIFINGARVGDHVMAPGWTSYNHRLCYQVFDVSGMLKEGPNVIAAEVGEGWYATRLLWAGGRRHIYGKEIGILAQLEVDFEDGLHAVTISSDESWKSHPSAILRSEIYDDEVYDQQEEQQGWKDTTSF